MPPNSPLLGAPFVEMLVTGARPLHSQDTSDSARPAAASMYSAQKTLAIAISVTLVAMSTALGQIPGAPVLQNAFANPGLAVAANFGGGGGQSLLALAAGWGLGSGRILVSAAAGAQRVNEATRGAYGGRASMTAWTSAGGSLGIAGFAGIGGAPRTRANDVMTNPAIFTVPLGLTVGYRRNIGTARGISAYASPIYRWTRLTADDDGTVSDNNFRFALGLDFSFNPSLGVTVGGEFGSRSSEGSSTLGAAVSWVPGGRR